MLSKTDHYFIQKSLLLAQKAEQEGEVPVGALIVYENEIIANGWNQPIQLNDPTAHAEIMALRNASKQLSNYRLNKATLYVTLEPCAMCVGAMIHARIERVVFGAWDKKAGAVHSVFQLIDDPRFNHVIEWKGGVMEKECSEMLKVFFKGKRLLISS